MKKKFTIARRERKAPAKDIDQFVAGVEPEVTKTFRIPAGLGRRLRIHAAQTDQTEKDILIRLLTEYLDSKS
jgi:hypothetical protein